MKLTHTHCVSFLHVGNNIIDCLPYPRVRRQHASINLTWYHWFALFAVLMTAALLGGCQSTSRARLYDGLDGYHRAITTNSDEAQKWFDQGIQMLYGFNHDEAIRSFHQAAKLDPTAPMPWWGIAYAHGININDPVMTPERSQAARQAADQALERIDNTSPVERALISAVSARYAWPAPEDRKPLDETYAQAMGKVYASFPDDPDVAALYAESLMDLQPWDYWDNAGNPKGRAAEIVRVLENVIRNHPDHPGGHHFYIHAVEASANPDRGIASAEKLAGLVPGAGHLEHMPSHIYVRVGRYADAVDTNKKAVSADRAYLKRAPKPALYTVYIAHNLHFLAYSAMMSGRYEDAIRAARDLEREVPEDALRTFAGLIEGIMPTTFHVLVRFGKWEQVLEEPDYPEYRFVSRAVRRYARSVALSALGRTDEARDEMNAFEEAVALVPKGWYVFNNKIDTVLPIARAMIQGELLFREDKREEAYAVLRRGVEAEDALVYDEPPGWMLPVRHALGALLMADSRFEEAQQVYREDLARNRDNGWGLIGLQRSLIAQSKTQESDALTPLLTRAWWRADVKPTSSCYCQP